METRTMVGIKLSVEGIHHFPNASKIFGDDVKFLEMPHRHNFGIECKTLVNHDNRDKEFILLKREVSNFLTDKFSHPSYKPALCEFGSMSCEMIAKEILNYFNFEYVRVDEDGENYAEVYKVYRSIKDSPIENKNEGIVKQPQLLKSVEFIVGNFCSGKTTFAHELVKSHSSKGQKVRMIEVSSLVKNLTKNSNSQRIFDKKLDQVLIEELKNIIYQSRYETNILQIIGIRQPIILTELIVYLKNIVDVNFDLYWIVCRKDERARRFMLQCQEDTLKNKGLSFEDIEEKERELGIYDMFQLIARDLLDSCRIVGFPIQYFGENHNNKTI